MDADRSETKKNHNMLIDIPKRAHVELSKE